MNGIPSGFISTGPMLSMAYACCFVSCSQCFRQHIRALSDFTPHIPLSPLTDISNSPMFSHEQRNPQPRLLSVFQARPNVFLNVRWQVTATAKLKSRHRPELVVVAVFTLRAIRTHPLPAGDLHDHEFHV